jgi:hypothetical protein
MAGVVSIALWDGVFGPGFLGRVVSKLKLQTFMQQARDAVVWVELLARGGDIARATDL